MSPLQFANIHDSDDGGHTSEDSLSVGHADGYGFTSFVIEGLNTDPNSDSGYVEDEIILLSWLLVLLRISEDGQVSFGWNFDSPGEIQGDQGSLQHLAMQDAFPSLTDTVRDSLERISRKLKTTSSANMPRLANTASLVLSTASLNDTHSAQSHNAIYIEVRTQRDRLDIRPLKTPENTPEIAVTRYIESLVETVRLCVSDSAATIERCMRLTSRDLDEIWSWNHVLPPYYDFCMHEKISENAQKFPDKVAISSWDGDLTYGEIDRFSSSVAFSLRDLGVDINDVVPICFEKSKWTIVAVLAAMKSGATFAMMDPSLPLARLQNMAEQVGSKMMLSSRKEEEFSNSISPNGRILIIDEALFKDCPDIIRSEDLPRVPADTLMYIIFTSGSTGTPKGVKISHGTYTSSALPRAKAVGYVEDSRVLDFASYAFDVSIDSMLLTVGNGGCLCIPSDEDRLNDINEAMKRMRVTYAGLTPSVARILDPEVIASLSSLGLGGEAVSARDVNVWGQVTRIVIGYGPCECTIGCTINSSAANGRDYISIGEGNGAAMWIVDPNDHETLMPVGAVGELLVEGPIVGQGYLNDPEKTAAGFIEDPAWLVAGHKNNAGRQGRLYKTGDLGRFDPDGSGGIVFVGRKDTQVKLRGQRVELGEIESQLKTRLPSEASVIAEVIVPAASGGQPTLVAFIAFKSTRGGKMDELTLLALSKEHQEAVTKANAEVSKTLPRYMVPTAYIPVNHLPVLISGKTDRRQLKGFGSKVDLRQLDNDAASSDARELNDLEEHLRHAWSQILKIEATIIRPNDNFFALGGDSLTAMRLVSLCRTQNLDLTVVNTFGHPTLEDMATVVKVSTSETRAEIPPFSLISQTATSACIEASQICGTRENTIQDIYPCTPTQESLFTFSLKSVEPYVAQRVAQIPATVGVDALKKAWEDVVAAIPILRTRVCQLQDSGLQQVVLQEAILWQNSDNLAQYLEDDRNQRMELGQSLARYAIVNDSSDHKHYFVWTVHHVLYDGWSEPIILQNVSRALEGRSLELHTQMRDFVQFVASTDEQAMQEFWRQQLQGAIGPQFPRLPSRDFLPTADAMLERHIQLKLNAGSSFTIATLIRGAWALVASQYTGSDDVVFGETLTGRDISLQDVESIIGPMIATVPVRIKINRQSTVESYLQAVQQTMLARTPYQHMGMQNIRKVSQDAQHACEAPTGLVIQPDPEYSGSELGFAQGDVVREALHFNPYPLMVAFGLQQDGFRACASFDSSLITNTQMERVLTQLETACSQLANGLSKSLNDVSWISDAEMNKIWSWNQHPPFALDAETGRLRAQANVGPGTACPPAIVSWVCDVRNPAQLSPIGCVGELWLEGPLCSENPVDSPAWLLAGSPAHAGRRGKLHATGDIVQLQEDGSIIFIRRKENVLQVQGHSVDVAELEPHLRKYLSGYLTSAAVASLSSSGKQELVVFIEHPASPDDKFSVILSDHIISINELGSQSFETSLRASITTDLATDLRGFDKFAKDSLPSYLKPSVYLVIDKFPTKEGQVDHRILNSLASKVPQSILVQLREGFEKGWAASAVQANLTDSERILRDAWSKVLGMDTDKIDANDNFFRLGGDSVLAMKLSSNLRVQGHKLSVGEIFRHMRLVDAAKVLKIGESVQDAVPAYKPFSLLNQLSIAEFLVETVRPQLHDPSWTLQDVFPVTDSQALDIAATIQAPRTSIQYTTLTFDNAVDSEALIRACGDLVKTHDILRTVFVKDNSVNYQVVLQDVKIPVIAKQTDQAIDTYVTQLCTEDIESTFEYGSPFVKLIHVQGQNGKQCLVIGLSHALYDGFALPRLLHDLETLYTGRKVEDFVSFSSYVACIREEKIQDKAIDYWRNLLAESSVSLLENRSVELTDKSIFNERAVHIPQHPEEFTTATILTAAWALVLSRRLQKTDVTFGGITSGRTIDSLPNIENVVGPCYQFTPIRVTFQQHWATADLLRFVQRQAADSAAHDFLGFERIQSQCTSWSSEVKFFDSIVHHQDAGEDIDTMPFAGGECKLDLVDPHGDAAYPLKVVSFVKAGETHVGVVGSEKDPEYIEGVLGDLVKAVEYLAGSEKDGALLDGALF